MPDGATIQRMFAEVAPGYDRANHALSLGVDLWWRHQAVAMTGVVRGERGLDVCAGTGDLSLALQRCGAEVVGADFCAPMLVRAAAKVEQRSARPRFLAADALALPFGDAGFDFATVAFGIRNVSDPRAALREMVRVVRPGGRVVVLEFCKPRFPLLASAYRFYFRFVLPALGSWICGTKNGAYRYLHDSVMGFPERDDFLLLMREAGLQSPRMRLLTGGIAALYRGEVSR
ncbi:MAG TPA: ubiquinone/menaquinone biosynthesis methyltransferase [Planctomycetota bacterium]|nr:ubiquinone/menaquinone biosynthesis methyltransferase [Planctomycetota bacterium]